MNEQNKLKLLSKTEETLYKFIEDNKSVTFDDIQEQLGPKYVGAVGKLKGFGLIKIVKKDTVDTKTWHGSDITVRKKFIELTTIKSPSVELTKEVKE